MLKYGESILEKGGSYVPSEKKKKKKLGDESSWHLLSWLTNIPFISDRAYTDGFANRVMILVT